MLEKIYLRNTLEDTLQELTRIFIISKSEKGIIKMTKSELAVFTLDVIELVRKIYMEE